MPEGIWLDEDAKEAAGHLLEKFWIIRNTDPDLYKFIKDREKRLKKFFQEKFGFQLVVHRFFIRLIKLPGEVEPWMGIEDFKAQSDYVLLCCLLAFLEEKGAEEQFLLSELTEAIQLLHPEPTHVDWTQYDMRKSLVRVLQFVRKEQVILVIDGEESGFNLNLDAEVLYENTPQARYFLRVFPNDLANSEEPEDLLGNDWLGDDENQGLLRRHRIYRRIFLSPCVYPIDEHDLDFLYLKNYRNTIQNDVQETFPASFELYNDIGLMVFNEKKQIFTLFPDNRTITDMVMQLAGIVREKIAMDLLKPDYLGKIQLTRVDFQNLVTECFDYFNDGWAKKHREQSLSALCDEFIDILTDWKMLEVDEQLNLYYLLPLLARSIGHYPDDFVKVGEADDDE